MAIKAIAGRHFSLLSFGIAQVAMDIEPLVGIIRGADVLHGTTHTYLAALAIAIAVIIVAPPLCRPILRHWNAMLMESGYDRFVGRDTPGSLPVILGAFAGTLSHVALDSIMHTDIRPLSPFSAVNALHGLISIDALEAACIASGIAGAALWLAAAKRRGAS